MPDLGFRENVMGPQPIGKVVVAPAEMTRSLDALMHALMSGDHAAAEAMTEAQALEDLRQIANAIAPADYDKYELVGHARIAQHFYNKVRLAGPKPMTIQFRLGKDGERWTVREATNLTGRRSGWSK